MSSSCVQQCHSFVWGGSGNPVYDEAQSCACVCDPGYLEHNILGRASCVPAWAHTIFGGALLFLGLVALWHAVYNLRLQRACAVHHVGASSEPENCRRRLHMTTIAYAIVILFLSLTILLLRSDQLRWSVFVLGVAISTASTGGAMTMRMWIYTIDPRLTRQSSVVRYVSAVLAHPLELYISTILVASGGVGMSILAVANNTQTGSTVAAVVFILLCVFALVLVVTCGGSLLVVTNQSIKRSQERERIEVTTGADHSRMCSSLQDAWRKVFVAVIVCVNLSIMSGGVLTFAVLSDYGAWAPLVFVVAPLCFGPLLWLPFNIQLHSGRSRGSDSRQREAAGGTCFWRGGDSGTLI